MNARRFQQQSLRGITAISCASVLLLASGCGGAATATHEVTGEVYYKGQPVEGASVVFAAKGPLAKGVTDAAGKFTLRTQAEGDGAIVGKHNVTITKLVVEPSTADNPYSSGRNVLPPRYANPNTSQLTAEVTAEGERNFRFDLVE